MWQGHSYTRPSSAESRFKFRCDPGYITESGKAVTVHMGHNQICDLSGCPTKPAHELISPTASKVEKWGGGRQLEGSEERDYKGVSPELGLDSGPHVTLPTYRGSDPVYSSTTKNWFHTQPRFTRPAPSWLSC